MSGPPVPDPESSSTPSTPGYTTPPEHPTNNVAKPMQQFLSQKNREISQHADNLRMVLAEQLSASRSSAELQQAIASVQIQHTQEVMVLMNIFASTMQQLVGALLTRIDSPPQPPVVINNNYAGGGPPPPPQPPASPSTPPPPPPPQPPSSPSTPQPQPDIIPQTPPTQITKATFAPETRGPPTTTSKTSPLALTDRLLGFLPTLEGGINKVADSTRNVYKSTLEPGLKKAYDEVGNIAELLPVQKPPQEPVGLTAVVVNPSEPQPVASTSTNKPTAVVVNPSEPQPVASTSTNKPTDKKGKQKVVAWKEPVATNINAPEPSLDEEEERTKKQIEEDLINLGKQLEALKVPQEERTKEQIEEDEKKQRDLLNLGKQLEALKAAQDANKDGLDLNNALSQNIAEAGINLDIQNQELQKKNEEIKREKERLEAELADKLRKEEERKNADALAFSKYQEHIRKIVGERMTNIPPPEKQMIEKAQKVIESGIPNLQVTISKLIEKRTKNENEKENENEEASIVRLNKEINNLEFKSEILAVAVYNSGREPGSEQQTQAFQKELNIVNQLLEHAKQHFAAVVDRLEKKRSSSDISKDENKMQVHKPKPSVIPPAKTSKVESYAHFPERLPKPETRSRSVSPTRTPGYFRSRLPSSSEILAKRKAKALRVQMDELRNQTK
jgi:hypothetical protein